MFKRTFLTLTKEDGGGILFIDVLRVSHADRYVLAFERVFRLFTKTLLNTARSSLRVVFHLKMSVHYTAVRRSRHKMSSREGLSPHHFPVL